MSDIDYLDNQYVMFGEIDEEKAGQFVGFLIEHHQQPERVDEIYLHLNTPGGEVSSAFAIIDAIQMSSIPIRIIGTGMVGSMGVLILSSGDTRYLTRNAEIMAHQFHSTLSGNFSEMKRDVVNAEQLYVKFLNHFLETTKMNVEEIEKYALSPHDVYLTPKQCVELGICDEVLSKLHK